MENTIPHAARESMDAFYNEIANYPVLKWPEQQELFKTMQKWSKNKSNCGQRTRKKGKAAREKLINSNLRLVVRVTQKYLGLGLDQMDLIAEGNIGLMKAVDKFEFDKGARFSTYAAIWVRQGIFRALDNHGRLVRVPSHANQKYAKIVQWCEDQKEKTGEQPTVAEISEKFKTSEDRVISIMEARKSFQYLDAPVGKDSSDGDDTFGDILPDFSSTPEANVEIANNKEILNKLLKKLPVRERFILIRRFALNDRDFETLEDIGARYKITRERIRQLEFKALKKLRKLLYNEFNLNNSSVEDNKIHVFKF